MPIADFFTSNDDGDQTEQSEEFIYDNVPEEAEEKKTPTIDTQDLMRHVASMISSKFKDVSESDIEKFNNDFAFWGGLILSIVGFEDLEVVLKVLKPIPPFAKLGIVLGSMFLIFILLKPRPPKSVSMTEKPKANEKTPVDSNYAPPNPNRGNEHVQTVEHPERVVKDVVIPNKNQIENSMKEASTNGSV